MKPVIIVGSARKQGNTKKVANALSNLLSCTIIDLQDYNIPPYDYDHNYQDDEFIPLIKELIASYDTLIFATPVYWYSMSSALKIFFDRLTDLLETEKESGRKLRSKHTATLSSSNGSNLGEDFWIPFTHTAEYLGMNYLGNVHTLEDADNTEYLIRFSEELRRNWFDRI